MKPDVDSILERFEQEEKELEAEETVIAETMIMCYSCEDYILTGQSHALKIDGKMYLVCLDCREAYIGLFN